MRKKFIINKNTIKQKSRKIITIITNIVYFFRYIYIQREFCTYTQEWYTESYDNIKTGAKQKSIQWLIHPLLSLKLAIFSLTVLMEIPTILCRH